MTKNENTSYSIRPNIKTLYKIQVTLLLNPVKKTDTHKLPNGRIVSVDYWVSETGEEDYMGTLWCPRQNLVNATRSEQVAVVERLTGEHIPSNVYVDIVDTGETMSIDIDVYSIIEQLGLNA